MGASIEGNYKRSYARGCTLNHNKMKWLVPVSNSNKIHVFPGSKMSEMTALLHAQNLSFKQFLTKHFRGFTCSNGDVYVSTTLKIDKLDHDFYHYIDKQLENPKIIPVNSWHEVGKAIMRMWAAEKRKTYEEIRNQFQYQTYLKYQETMGKILQGEVLDQRAGCEDYSYIIKSTKAHVSELLIMNILFSGAKKVISILDLGTDIGMLPALAYKFFRGYGYEPLVSTSDIQPSDSFKFLHRKFTEEGTLINFFPMNFLEIDRYKGVHDFIAMNQVIEHFTEEEYMHILNNVLRTNCRKALLMTVPLEKLNPTWGHKSEFDSERLRKLAGMFPQTVNLSGNIVGFNGKPLIDEGFLILVKDRDLAAPFMQTQTCIKDLLRFAK